MKYRIAIYLISVIAILSGCWGRSELKDVGIVSGIGIDKGIDSGFELTTQTIKPVAHKVGSPTTVLVQTSRGVTIFDAIRNFIITAKKKQNFQHIHTIVIGKEIAKNGVTPVLDFFIRDHEPRFTMELFIAEDKAKDILKIQNNNFPIPSLTMKESVKVQRSLSKAPQMNLHNFFQRLLEPYQDPYLPIIHKNKDDFEVYGTAIFNGDKLAGELTAMETRGMLRVLGEAKGGIQVIQLSSSNEKPVHISIEIKSSESFISTTIENGQPTIQIEIKETGFIGELSQRIMLNEKNIQYIKQLYADAIENEVKQTVSKIQKDFKANIFDFAGTIRRTEKHYWKQHYEQWEEIYPNLKVNVKVKTDITGNGLEEDFERRK